MDNGAEVLDWGGGEWATSGADLWATGAEVLDLGNGAGASGQGGQIVGGGPVGNGR